MPLKQKLAQVAKAVFSSSDGSAVTLNYGQGSNPEAGPLVDLTGYLSAQPPLPAFGPGNYEMRQRDFRLAENIDYIPGSGKFTILRAFADRWNVLRSMIDTKKDLLASMPWDIKADPKPGETKKDANQRSLQDPIVSQLRQFFQSPDGERTYFEWMKQFLEEVVVLDAGCIEMARDRKGRIAKMVVISGDTINRVIDDRGWTPLYPQVAYQQILSGAGSGAASGVPQRNYTTKDLLYCMRNPRAFVKWGQSSVEKIYIYCLTGIMADDFIKDYYTGGNQPPGFLILGNMTASQVEEYDKKFNAVFQGNLAARRKIALLSGGLGDQSKVQYIPTKEPLLSTDIYEQFIRFAAYELSVSSTNLTKPMNRASAQAGNEQNELEGLQTDIAWLTGIMNKIIKDPQYLNCPDYSWVPGPRRELDALKQMQVDTGYAKNAVLAVNEIREDLGKEPFKIDEANEPGVMTPNNGFVPLSSDKATAVLQARQQNNNPSPQQPQKPAQPVKKFAAGRNSITTDMSPKDFLAACGSTEGSILATNEDVNKLFKMRQALNRGEQLPSPQLDYDVDGNLIGVDGRHRALAALKEDLSSIPVIVTRPVGLEKAAKISPETLSSVSSHSKTQVESKVADTFKKLRSKTLAEIGFERTLRGKKNG